jgi:hypothetical protein
MTDTPRPISADPVLSAPALDDFLPIVDVSEPLLVNRNKRILLDRILGAMRPRASELGGVGTAFDAITAVGHNEPNQQVTWFSSSNPNFTSACSVLATSRAPGVSCSFLYCVASQGSTPINTFTVANNGNVFNTNNSYSGLSDLKLKENIVDSGSQWSDIKALRIRKYNFKQGETHTQLGVIAQEVELVSPGLVSENVDRDGDGNLLSTTTKSVNYSVLYMKAVKALQEAMERIEALEDRVAALEGS